MSTFPVSRVAAVALLAVASLAAALSGCVISLQRLNVTVWPANANAVLATGSSPWVDFPSAPDEASVQRLFTLSSFAGSVTGDFRWDGNRMYFDPAPPLSPGVRYVLQFRGRVTLDNGESFDASEEVPFYILHADGGPFLLSAVPTDGSAAGTSTPLVLSFSGPVDPNSFAQEFTVQPSAETLATWNTPGHVTITPKTAWTTLTTYTWKVSKNLLAPDGTPTGVDYGGKFRIQLDATAPTVDTILPGARSSPSFDSTGLPLSQTGADDVLRLTFSEDVTGDSLTSAFTLSPSTKGTLYSVTSGTPSVFAFVPESRWIMGQTYTLHIGTGLADLSGNKLSTAYETSFTPAIPLQAVTTITTDDPARACTHNTLDANPITVNPPLDPEVTLAVTFDQAFSVDAEIRLLSGVVFENYFPTSLDAPSLKTATWSPAGRTLTLTYTGLEKSTATSNSYYKLTLPSGVDASDNGSGSFLKDSIWLYFVTNQ